MRCRNIDRQLLKEDMKPQFELVLDIVGKAVAKCERNGDVQQVGVWRKSKSASARHRKKGRANIKSDFDVCSQSLWVVSRSLWEEEEE